MSRSRRKSQFVTDNHGHNFRRKFMKKYSNKSLRSRLKNSDELMQGSEFKKHFESWDICDYKYFWSKEDAIDTYYRRIHENGKYGGVNRSWFARRYPTLNDWLKYYYKTVVYK